MLSYLKSLFPLNSLDLKHLTWKLCTLLALTTAARAQTLVSLSVNNMCVNSNGVVFYFTSLLKTSRPGRSYYISLYTYSDKKLCVLYTLHEYIDRTREKRKCDQLLVSYKTYKRISTSIIARWIIDVMGTTGIDITLFKAHSIRSASSSIAFRSGASLADVLKTGDWSSAKNFQKFYCRDTCMSENDHSNTFMNAVLQT